MHVKAYGLTHVGRQRQHNEDSFLVADEAKLYLVADGMGGHASGEVASKMAIETLREFFSATSQDPEATWPYKMDGTLTYDQNRLVTFRSLMRASFVKSSHSSVVRSHVAETWPSLT